ncbi:hypothetical protein D9613_008640 [Agrocybe pediades]|uniref:NADAR domain-containing protein n=1 Tax=Agrocybe pediades TaxID=84607 RepID=A0A8H4QTA1_9AGAR|nr:hypothetical protein D9613_008640 [Agrocybe pediades]KAF9566476.1 DUF1768-domain-containing protein [Agrocybe pediades]
MHNPEDYIFFWKPNETFGWASQWYPCQITTSVTLEDKAEEVVLPSAEHYMMLQKALLFGDTAIARQILEVTGAGQTEMAHIKQLGRKVQGFDEAKWIHERERIVLEGNILKFQQNKDLRQKLLSTDGRILVEASPRDRIWGVGYGAKNALSRKDEWGLNLLGKALEKARQYLVRTPNAM